MRRCFEVSASRRWLLTIRPLQLLIIPLLPTVLIVACEPEALEGRSSPSSAAATPWFVSEPTLSPTAGISSSEDEAPLEPTSTFSLNLTQTALPAPVLVPASFPNLEDYEWGPVVNGLSRPVALAHAGDGSGRLFVVEQKGLIRIVHNRELLTDPFLEIRDRIGSGGDEQGLLGLAFHPRYAENGFFYLNYNDHNGDTVIARFRVSDDPNRADPASEMRLLHVLQPYPNHNGGVLTFGPDGYLYAGLGDGGSAGDPQGNAQSLDTLLGKILRLDVDGGDPYAIPINNFHDEIWAFGLRNPWRMSFDRLTGELYIGDVGQNKWEEIDFLPAGRPSGANFGWDYREGTHPFEGSPPAGLELVDPIAEYGHDAGISVTGGVVYRGKNLPAWQGVYIYGDYGSGLVWGLLRRPDGVWQQEVLFESGANIASFGEDEAGEVYLVDHKGIIYMLVER